MTPASIGLLSPIFVLTPREIVEPGTPRRLVPTAVLRIRIILRGSNRTYQSCTNPRARCGATRRKVDRDTKDHH
jgi:hypothetical protein